MASVREELDKLIENSKDSYAGISNLLGRNPAYIQQFIKRGSPSKLDEQDRQVLANYFGVDEHILGGSPTSASGSMMEIFPLTINEAGEVIQICEQENNTARVAFDKSWLNRLTQSNAKNLRIHTVSGDSMKPTLDHNDKVLVDTAPGIQLRNGIYVLRSNNSLTIKRVSLNPSNKKITVSSDNKIYENWVDLDGDSIHTVGRVLWLCREF